MSEQEQLAQTLANIEADQELTPATWIGFHRIAAAALLNSPWLAARDSRIKAETLNEAANRVAQLSAGTQPLRDAAFLEAFNLVMGMSQETWARMLADRAKEETE